APTPDHQARDAEREQEEKKRPHTAPAIVSSHHEVPWAVLVSYGLSGRWRRVSGSMSARHGAPSPQMKSFVEYERNGKMHPAPYIALSPVSRGQTSRSVRIPHGSYASVDLRPAFCRNSLTDRSLRARAPFLGIEGFEVTDPLRN